MLAEQAQETFSCLETDLTALVECVLRLGQSHLLAPPQPHTQSSKRELEDVFKCYDGRYHPCQ